MLISKEQAMATERDPDASAKVVMWTFALCVLIAVGYWILEMVWTG